MIEPRAIALHLHRRDSSQIDGHDVSQLSSELFVEHDEPERPIHPALEYEVLAARDDDELDETFIRRTLESQQIKQKPHTSLKLVISFLFLVIAGTGNVVSAKLQAIPMYNYPNFLNLFSTFMYIPICFLYIIPAARYGWFNNAITPEQLALPKLPFAIMGALDCLATSMQVFASIYLPGPLLVLLPQAAIPCSMVLSRYILGQRYRRKQYVGAIVVLVGILVVLEPVMTHRRAPDFKCEAINVNNDCTVCQVEVTEDSCMSHRQDQQEEWWLRDKNNNTDGSESSLCQWLPFSDAIKKEEELTFVWSLVMVASTAPMAISTIYKEIALGEGTELDPIYLNGWISIFQFLFSLILAVPAGILASPSVKPMDLPENLWDGILCFEGHGSIDSGCHPDTMCSFHAAFFVSLALVCNLFYTFFMMFILKYGSTSLLFLALTAMVPFGNLAFSLPFMPQATPLHVSDLLGLVVIMSGLILYRFWGPSENDDDSVSSAEGDPLSPPGTTPWFQELMRQLREPLLEGDPLILGGGMRQLQEPLLETGEKPLMLDGDEKPPLIQGQGDV